MEINLKSCQILQNSFGNQFLKSFEIRLETNLLFTQLLKINQKLYQILLFRVSCPLPVRVGHVAQRICNGNTPRNTSEIQIARARQPRCGRQCRPRCCVVDPYRNAQFKNGVFTISLHRIAGSIARTFSKTCSYLRDQTRF